MIKAFSVTDKVMVISKVLYEYMSTLRERITTYENPPNSDRKASYP